MLNGINIGTTQFARDILGDSIQEWADALWFQALMSPLDHELTEEGWNFLPLLKVDNTGVYAVVELDPSVVVFGSYHELEAYVEECFATMQENDNIEVIRLN